MAEELDLQQAQQTYETLCRALDKNEWHYNRHDEHLAITATARGEDFPIEFSVEVDAKRKLILLLSRLDLRVPEDKLVMMAVAVSVANNGMVFGGFDYNIQEGRILFRLSNSYMGCELSEDAFLQMIYTACGTVDNYNDSFLMLCKGLITLEQFIQKENA